ISLYLLTIAYSLMAGRVRNVRFFAYAQLVLDVGAEIILVSITGGIESLFSFILILTVLSSSIVINSRAGYIIASLSSILYGVVLDLQFYRLLPLSFDTPASEKVFLYNIFVHILAFYVTAYLGGYLSHRLAKTELLLEEQDTQLKDLELFNIKVIESLPSGLFTTDVSGKILIFNRAAEKITGLNRNGVIGSHIGDVLPFLPVPLREGRRDKVILLGTEGEKIIGITISALEDISGKDTGHIGVFQDLTQLKKLEAEIQQKEKWAAIGELSSNIAHEIRNPLASMKGSLEMLRDRQIPEKHKNRLMDIALHEMERLNDIITDFLTYSRPKPLEIRRVDLHLILDETLALLKNIGMDRGNIVIAREFDSPLFALVDPQKMRQVFWNLGMNAIEAMRTGGRLTVRTQVSPGQIAISFEDTGVGIDQADIDRIFYPFFTTKDAGTGLGLSIAYRIIEEHQGTITISSIPGIKTIFTIILRSRDGEL
ncbi:MAG: ATP-binding protein, partial [Thermodesulfovibrionales bacterium]